MMATTSSLSKFVIRESLKAALRKRHFASLEELFRAVRADLEEDGFVLNSDHLALVRRIVEEEGYTGRFAFDDILRRRIRDRRLWPLLSVLAAVFLFVAAQVAGALIEYAVQKPLQGGPAATPISAVIQVPPTIEGDTLHFSLSLRNLSEHPLTNLTVFASADEALARLVVERLEGGAEASLEGELNIRGLDKKSLKFVAYIVGSGVSFQSEPVTVARTGATVAMAFPASQNQLERVAAKKETNQSFAQGQAVASLDEVKTMRSSGAAVADRTSTFETAPASAKPVAPAAAQAGPPAAAPAADAASVPVACRMVPADQQIAELARQARTSPPQRAVLAAYAEAGYPGAREALAQLP